MQSVEGAPVGIGAHGERARRRVGLGRPARRVVGAGDVGARGAGVEQAHLPHRLGTRRGVRAAEGDLAQGRILDDAQVPGPHVDVGDVHARVGRRRRRPPRAVGTADDGRARRQIGLGEHRRERLVLAQHAVDVVAPGRQPEVGAGGDQPEPRRVDRRAGGADDVEQRGAAEMGVDVLLLVPIGVEVDAALLLAHARGVASGVERRSTDISLHRWSLTLSLLRWVGRTGRPRRARTAGTRPGRGRGW